MRITFTHNGNGDGDDDDDKSQQPPAEGTEAGNYDLPSEIGGRIDKDDKAADPAL